ncbi:MAG: heterodisulfide reductase, subunit B [Thermoplasmata archaeon]|nr:MAG: heterodisulfide reductase, subunit B [Thermoplasmata archaeon]RLF37467.1 MAG: heterodisulfide reductase, subunit B [Thermoplasmata archaeon]RLF52146.1 MAG: heterodisulfide reductase, subunit B [Thermoplasmata archaeon]
MKLLYFPGCTLKTSAKNLEKSAFAITKALGHELVEMDDWTCCGVVSSLSDDDLMRHLAPLRNLIHVEDQGENRVVVLCDMCCNTLKQTNLRVKEKPDDLETLNLFMDRENDYRGTVKVQHFLEFLRDDVGFNVLKKMVKKPLKNLKIMPYYGCMLLRPREVAVDDAEEPTILSDLLSALGVEVVDNPFKIECCGSYHTIQEKELVSRRAYRIASYAIERGADAIVLSCPLCRFNLDVRGKEAEKMFNGYKQLPVFYYTQLIAVALGLDPSVYGFDQHAVDPTLLLKKKGVLEVVKNI